MKFLKLKNLIIVSVLVFVISFFVVDFSLAQDIEFTNPLQYDTVDALLPVLLNRLQGIIVVLSLVFIVVGAILYITSAGNESRMTMAKGAVVASVIGLAIGIAAPSFLREISTILGWGVNEACADIQDPVAREACVRALVESPTLTAIALNVLNFLLAIVGVIAIIMLVAAGIMYLTSAGSEDRINTAKDMTKWAIIGITIALASLVIVRQIASFFS